MDVFSGLAMYFMGHIENVGNWVYSECYFDLSDLISAYVRPNICVQHSVQIRWRSQLDSQWDFTLLPVHDTTAGRYRHPRGPHQMN
jgi:hypothetical protein